MKRLVLALALVMSVGSLAQAQQNKGKPAQAKHACEVDSKAAMAQVEQAIGMSLSNPEATLQGVLSSVQSSDLSNKEALEKAAGVIEKVQLFMGIMKVAAQKSYTQLKGVDKKAPSGLAVDLMVGQVVIMAGFGEEMLKFIVVGIKAKIEGKEPSEAQVSAIMAKLQAFGKKVEGQKSKLEAAQKALSASGISAKEKEKFGNLTTTWGKQSEILVCKASFKAFIDKK